MERHTAFVPGEYYHVYNRGVNKQKIFLSDGDWRYFQRLLYIRNDASGHVRPDRSKRLLLSEIAITDPLVDIQAYVLMPNHFHIVLKEREPGGITTYMRRLLTSYAMYINKKYTRSGPLMCRPFRSKHIASDEYMRWLISYIHLNPVAKLQASWEETGVGDIAAAAALVREYPYSSYVDYFVTDRDEGRIIHKESLPMFISELEDFATMQSTYLESREYFNPNNTL